MIDAKPLLAFVALTWDVRADQPAASIRMPLGDQAEQVGEAESLVDDCMQLMDRRVAYMALGW